MSPASKSKAMEKLPAKTVKEQGKVSSKPVLAVNHGNGVQSSGYNPDSGTFHNFDTTSSVSVPGQNNGRFGTIDETEDHSVSTTGDSGEDEQKEKTTSNGPRIESIPGCDTDKREKIRQKNERKHQRQKERRAQELHERCSGYLMSRKLEMLAQKIVAMGFSSEEATMALIQNEGRVEESISWLLELSEESKHHIAANIDSSVNMKIDITAELVKISDLEVKFKCTKQEVERAVVACEGDLEKTEETLKAHKQEVKAAPLKLEEADDSVTASGTLDNKMVMPVQNVSLRPQLKGAVPVVTLQRREEQDLSHNKTFATGVAESVNKNLRSSRRLLPKTDWGRPQVVASMDKRWSNGSSTSSAAYSLPTSLQVAVPPANRYVMTSNEMKPNLPSVALREPVIVMQRPQSLHAKQNPASTSPNITSTSPPTSTGWYPNGTSSMGLIKVENGGLLPSSSFLGLHGSTAQQFINPNHFRPASNPVDSFPTGWGTPFNPSSSSTLSPGIPSSPGLLTSLPSGLSASSSDDWCSSGSTTYDYTSIDWSMDTDFMKPSHKINNLPSTWSTMFMGGKMVKRTVNSHSAVIGIQGDSLATDDSSYSSGSYDWSSPFTGKDLLSIPRRYVTDSSP
ncbi:uncharacterized protein LOC121997398 [Zingiber officinale]|uniref:UBA domain-containing protein n=1 Tax=Zingiber officinale TaxID=94328 RepID=A0A8J5L180_ZINOF|nr:uncharacterized protein LOC121997398 [Zingiber officinale]XP_042407716.1 uncharacterized protein LOC121997398 [Zingiber officinale]KAG6500847.1 hypothetical protein ZIOFF_040705 [Zingiber officinale]